MLHEIYFKDYIILSNNDYGRVLEYYIFHFTKYLYDLYISSKLYIICYILLKKCVQKQKQDRVLEGFCQIHMRLENIT